MKNHAWITILALLLATTPTAALELRFATHNALCVNSPGSTEYEALLDQVDRIDADVLVLQEAFDNVYRPATAGAARKDLAN